METPRPVKRVVKRRPTRKSFPSSPKVSKSYQDRFEAYDLEPCLKAIECREAAVLTDLGYPTNVDELSRILEEERPTLCVMEHDLALRLSESDDPTAIDELTRRLERQRGRSAKKLKRHRRASVALLAMRYSTELRELVRAKRCAAAVLCTMELMAYNGDVYGHVARSLYQQQKWREGGLEKKRRRHALRADARRNADQIRRRRGLSKSAAARHFASKSSSKLETVRHWLKERSDGTKPV